MATSTDSIMSKDGPELDAHRSISGAREQFLDYAEFNPVPPLQFKMTSDGRGINYENLLQDHSRGARVIVEGPCGCGKTTYARHLAQRWTCPDSKDFKQFTLVLLFDCSRRAIDEAGSLRELIEVGCEGVEEREDAAMRLSEAISSDCSSTLFLIDGYDAISRENRLKAFSKSCLGRILNQQELPTLTAIVMTRASGLEGLRELCPQVDLHVQLHGFHADTARQYLSTLSSNLGPGHEAKVMDYLNYYPVLVDLCCNPAIAKAFVGVYEASGGVLPETLTEFFTMLLPALMSKHSASCSSSLTNVPGVSVRDLDTISRLALHCYLYGHLPANDIAHFCIKECIPNLECLKGMNLFETSFDRVGTKLQPSYKFLHRRIQEFLAARALTQLPLLDQFDVCVQNTNLISHKDDHFLHFCFGLTASETSLARFNPTKSALPTIIDALSHDLQLDSGGRAEQSLSLLTCVWEAREPALWRKLASRHPDMLVLLLEQVELTPLFRRVLATLMVHSGISKWELSAPDSDLWVANSLQVMVEVQSSGSTLVSVSTGDQFVLRPLQSSKPNRASSRDKTAQYFCLRCLRDTFHLILQLFSPVSLRSDVSDTSYLNFVACACMEKEVNKAVRIGPIMPHHWIQLPHKRRKGKHDSTTDIRHFESEHTGRTELVLIGCPYPQAIHVTLSGSGEEIFVPLWSQPEPLFSDGEIAAAVKHLSEDLVLCTHASSDVVDKRSGRVWPDLLIPGRKKTDSGYSSGAVQTAPAGQMVSHIVTRPTLPVPIAQSVASRPDKKRPFSYPPGYVIFSSIPSVMSKDNVYPLPDESTLIRKGGNGEIYEGDYAGVTFAVKKTIFRQREYNILMKLHHRNIMPLLLLMIGEAHPLHKRRVFSYHVMPHMSGDCARMITDHGHLTMKALGNKHRGDHVQLTFLQNNFKYLIREVLQGIAYLHSLHIVHRDIKASNILVKMYCGCDNPIICFCQTKCHVALSDFDACLQLSDTDTLEPLVLSGKTTDMYYVAPVGTQGFRAPEGTHLVVASSPDAFSPCISPKSDIWSLGVLLLRLLVGEEGPSSQREIGMLLLHYHQFKAMKEGNVTCQRRQYNFLQVPKSKVDKILKFPKLSDELSALPSGVDFTQQCLRVEPQARPAAEELLDHLFLLF